MTAPILMSTNEAAVCLQMFFVDECNCELQLAAELTALLAPRIARAFPDKSALRTALLAMKAQVELDQGSPRVVVGSDARRTLH